jgi:enamine deaminase RidA (YjgF/YER057c/UK114 family)
MFNNHIVSIRPEWDWEHAMPPAPAVRGGNTVYLSGQIALGSDGKLVGEGDLAAQAHQCFANIRAILQRAGGKMTDIVKLTTYFACELTESPPNTGTFASNISVRTSPRAPACRWMR